MHAQDDGQDAGLGQVAAEELDELSDASMHAQVDGQDAGFEPDTLSAGAINFLSEPEGASLPASSAAAHVAPVSERPRRAAGRPSYREARAYRHGGSQATSESPEGRPGSQGPSG